MLDLHKALADIESIRSQVARGTQFRGYGPATVALTGVLAIVAAGIQSVWLDCTCRQIDDPVRGVQAPRIRVPLIGDRCEPSIGPCKSFNCCDCLGAGDGDSNSFRLRSV